MTALRAEAFLTWMCAAGFGGATIPVAVYLRHNGKLPSFFGLFEMYGGPWWSRSGQRTFARLLMGFLVVSLVASFAAWLVWDGSTAGGILTLVLLPVEAWFWNGFDLPIPMVIGLARVVLLVMGWSSLG